MSASQLHSQSRLGSQQGDLPPSSPLWPSSCFNPCNKGPLWSQCDSHQTSKSRAMRPEMTVSFKAIATPKSLGSPSLRTLLYREWTWGHLSVPPPVPRTAHLRFGLGSAFWEHSAPAFQEGSRGTWFPRLELTSCTWLYALKAHSK